MRSETFRNVALAILALAAVYHLGARNAGAQQTVNGFATVGQSLVVMTPSGDLYVRNIPGKYVENDSLYYMGNFWKGRLAVPGQGHAQPSQSK